MPEPRSHHLIDPMLHVLVLTDRQPREARYRTIYDDGSKGETAHVLYWEADSGEVRSCPIEDWHGGAVQSKPFDTFVGGKTPELSPQAVELLRMIGAVDTDGIITRKP